MMDSNQVTEEKFQIKSVIILDKLLQILSHTFLHTYKIYFFFSSSLLLFLWPFDGRILSSDASLLDTLIKSWSAVVWIALIKDI